LEEKALKIDTEIFKKIIVMIMKNVLFIAILLISVNTNAQTCACEKEFLYIKNIVEQNFAGFPDRIKALSKNAYKKKTDELLSLTHNKFASDNCLLVISRYLDLFKSNHLGFSSNFDVYKIDTGFVNERPLFELKDEQLVKLKQSRSWEGIYFFTHDSSYKIAVIKDPTPLHDYVGVIIESKLPTWKKGMIKFEGKLVNDSLLMGLLYMRNHRPKREGFGLNDNNTKISGDWRREGTAKIEVPRSSTAGTNPPPIDAKRLTDKTFYIKIASFDPDFKPTVDAILKANENLLNSTPNLVLDLRDNGGGSDNVWESLVPYLYTGPIKNIGVDVLATEFNISGWKKYPKNENLSKENINGIRDKIAKMENAKGHWVNIANDEVDSSMKPKPFPEKIVILINKWCGSSTEELLLVARQSSKVILVGQNTIGNLDYSNVVQTPFSCFPYILRYATTRSRRLDIHQGIDNIGIAPKYRLKEDADWVKEDADWIKEALKILE
jgi:hypothetical protein